MPQNIHLNTRTMSLLCLEAELEFHYLKYFLTSYSPATQFLAIRSIWGLLKMISNDSLNSKHEIDSLTKSLACSEAELLLGVIQNLMPKNQKYPFSREDPVCCPRFSPKWMLDPESTPKTGLETGLRPEGYPLYGTWQ